MLLKSEHRDKKKEVSNCTYPKWKRGEKKEEDSEEEQEKTIQTCCTKIWLTHYA
jgi:hypothetical protein